MRLGRLDDPRFAERLAAFPKAAGAAEIQLNLVARNELQLPRD